MSQPHNLEADIAIESEYEQEREETSAGCQIAVTSPLTVPGHPEVPMPIRADANVPDPTETPTSPARHRQRNYILTQPGTPSFVIAPFDMPQLVGESIPVSVSIPQTVLRALGQGKKEFLTTSPSTPVHRILPSQTDGLFTPAELAEHPVTSTPIIPIQDLPKQALEVPYEAEEITSAVKEDEIPSSLAAEGTLPETLRPLLEADDIVGSNHKCLEALEDCLKQAPVRAFDRTETIFVAEEHGIESPLEEETSPNDVGSDQRHLEEVQEDKPMDSTVNSFGEEVVDVAPSENAEVVLGSQLSAISSDATPLGSIRVSSEWKTTDPILCADPYPYSLSTPGAALQIHPDSSEEVMEIFLFSNSTLEKGDEIDKGIKRVGNFPDESASELPSQRESFTQMENAHFVETSPDDLFVINQARVDPDIIDVPDVKEHHRVETLFRSEEICGPESEGDDTDPQQSPVHHLDSEA